MTWDYFGNEKFYHPKTGQEVVFNEKGDVVTVVLPNIPLTIYTFYALNALGVIQNILHPLSTFECKTLISQDKNLLKIHLIFLEKN